MYNEVMLLFVKKTFLINTFLSNLRMYDDDFDKVVLVSLEVHCDENQPYS